MSELVEVKLLKYTFRFRPLTWREEFTIKFPKKKDQTRVYLAHALAEVSGLKVKSVEEAQRVIDALPTAISSRVFRIFKGQLRENRKFTTADLYRAPEANQYRMTVEENEEKQDDVNEKAQAALRAKFSKKELEAAEEVDRAILEGSQLRGAVKVDPSHAE